MKPNVLCVGFAKCGTTTLYDILKQHPDIYLSGIKEPIYYSSEKLIKKGFNWYQKRYYPKKIKEKIIMEINPVIGKYVNASKILKDYGKNIKIIFMVRNPIKRLYSNFTMNLVKGDCFDKLEDNIGTENLLFDKWVIDNFLNSNGEIDRDVIPKFCKSGNYFNVIKNYINTFGKNNIKVVVFEDFIKNIEFECKKLFDFMGVPNYENINFNVYSNKGNRIPLNKLSIKIVKFCFKIWENVIIKRVGYISFKFSAFLNGLIWKTTHLLSKKTNRKEMSYCSKLILNNYYKEMCIKLSNLLSVDFVKKWNIDLQDIREEDIIVLKFKKEFQDKILKINKKYYKCAQKYNAEKFMEASKEHREMVKKIIYKILDYFPELHESQFIALNGSFASNTNIFESDIDLNFFNKSDDIQYLLVELKIAYILARLMDYSGCDRIHSIMVYAGLNKNINYEIKENNIIFDDSSKVPCYFRENYEQLLFETINSSRDYNHLLLYFNKKIKDREYVNAWLDNFLLIKDYGGYYYFNKQLKKNLEYLKKNYKKNIINETILEMIHTIDILNNYKFNDRETVCNLKKYHKSEIVKVILNTSFMIRFIDIEVKEKLKISKELTNILYKQLFIVMRLKMILKKNNIDLSSHSNKEIKKNEYENYAKRMFGKKNIFKKEKDNIKKIRNILQRLEKINV